MDEVAAEHVGADCVVHYGAACLSPSARLPLLYVFERRPLDVGRCAAAFRELHPDAQALVVLLYAVGYAHAIGKLPRRSTSTPVRVSRRALTSADDLWALLSPEYPNLVVSELDVEAERLCARDRVRRSSEDAPGGRVVREFGRRFCLRAAASLEDYRCFYVGEEGATLRNFMMTWNRCPFASFDPAAGAGRAESVNVNRALMRRYYAIERAKDARVVGVLVGTLGVADYLRVIEQLKETLRRAAKKSYLFAVGKLNVPKLANFLEIDVFVLVACPENSLLDSDRFYKPVVTPFEMDVACNGAREWSHEYVTDFRHLLPGESRPCRGGAALAAPGSVTPVLPVSPLQGGGATCLRPIGRTRTRTCP